MMKQKKYEKGKRIMAARNIQSAELRGILEENQMVLVDFWAPWCPHCRKIGPAYEEIAKEWAGDMAVVKLDMDESDSLWDVLRVELVPTIRLYEGGQAVRQIVAPKTKEALDAFLSA